MSIFKKENGTLVEYTNPIANNCIAPVEDGGTSAHAYAEGAFVMVRNILKKITSAVSIGDTIDNTNSQDTTVATELADIEGDIEQINTDLSTIPKIVTETKNITINAGGGFSSIPGIKPSNSVLLSVSFDGYGVALGHNSNGDEWIGQTVGYFNGWIYMSPGTYSAIVTYIDLT